MERVPSEGGDVTAIRRAQDMKSYLGDGFPHQNSKESEGQVSRRAGGTDDGTRPLHLFGARAVPTEGDEELEAEGHESEDDAGTGGLHAGVGRLVRVLGLGRPIDVVRGVGVSACVLDAPEAVVHGFTDAAGDAGALEFDELPSWGLGCRVGLR